MSARDEYAIRLAGLGAEALYLECLAQAKANVGRHEKTWRWEECRLECHQPRRPGGPGIWQRACEEAAGPRRETERGNAEALGRRKGGEQ